MSENSTPSPTVKIAEGPVLYLPREEVGLVDLALVLVRRWPVLLAGWVLIAGYEMWQWSQAPVRYESRAVVRIGRSRSSFPIKPTKEQQDMLLEPTPVAAMRVREQYGPASPLTEEFHGCWVTNTVYDKEADELLTILARGPDPQSAHDFLNRVVGDFVEGHRQLFGPIRQALETRLNQNREDQKKRQSELEAIPAQTNEQPGLLQARVQLLQQQLELEQEAGRLERDLADLQSQPTVELTPATLPVAPAEPRLMWFLLFGIGGGLIAGTLLAFAAEFFGQVRNRLS